jgi:hypothetical protein
MTTRTKRMAEVPSGQHPQNELWHCVNPWWARLLGQHSLQSLWPLLRYVIGESIFELICP